MWKRSFFIALSLSLIGFAWLVQAQGTQPLTQPTVDASVSTLLAQTAVASMQQATQLAATQTIRAALGQALTATAQMQITATPTPQTFDASHLSVSSADDIDLLSGPAATGSYLAPDGQQFAYLTSKTLCVYRGSTQGNCVDTTPTGGADSESLRWSPDSRYVVFTQDFFRTFRDPDIWVWDTVSNQLNDVTPNQGGRVNFLTSSDWTGVDVVPRWLPDGRILFLRYSMQSKVVLPPDIYVIAPDGSGLQKLGNLAVSDRFAVTALDVTATQLVYNYASQSGSPMDGVWISDLDGNNARQLIHVAHETPISGVQLSPDGRFVLINNGQIRPDLSKPETSRMFVVDVTTGTQSLIDPSHYVAAAGWSPQGSALVYITRSLEDMENDKVFVTNTPGTAGQQLSGLQGQFNLGTPRLLQTLIWSANNTLLLSHSPGKGIVLAHLS